MNESASQWLWFCDRLARFWNQGRSEGSRWPMPSDGGPRRAVARVSESSVAVFVLQLIAHRALAAQQPLFMRSLWYMRLKKRPRLIPIGGCRQYSSSGAATIVPGTWRPIIGCGRGPNTDTVTAANDLMSFRFDRSTSVVVSGVLVSESISSRSSQPAPCYAPQRPPPPRNTVQWQPKPVHPKGSI